MRHVLCLNGARVGKDDYGEPLTGKTENGATITRVASAVPNGLKAAILADVKARSVVEFRSILEFVRFQHLGDHLSPDMPIVEVSVPERQVLRRREEARRADVRVGQDTMFIAASPTRLI